MHVYIYTCIHIYVSIYIYTYTYIYICTHMYVNIYIYTCICKYIYTMYMYTYVCVRTWVASHLWRRSRGAPWLIRTCGISSLSYVWHAWDMMHSHLWHEFTFTCVAWVWHQSSHIWREFTFAYVAWLWHACDMSFTFARGMSVAWVWHKVWREVWHEVWHECGMRCGIWVWHECGIRCGVRCNMSHSRVPSGWHESFTCVWWLIRMCAMSSHVCHDSSTNVQQSPRSSTLPAALLCIFTTRTLSLQNAFSLYTAHTNLLRSRMCMQRRPRSCAPPSALPQVPRVFTTRTLTLCSMHSLSPPHTLPYFTTHAIYLYLISLALVISVYK